MARSRQVPPVEVRISTGDLPGTEAQLGVATSPTSSMIHHRTGMGHSFSLIFRVSSHIGVRHATHLLDLVSRVSRAPIIPTVLRKDKHAAITLHTQSRLPS